MTLDELVSAARYRVDDLVVPYLWSANEMIEYANDAQRQAVRNARLITDSSTVAICTIAVTAADGQYDLDQRILAIKRVKGSWSSIPLKPASMHDLDREYPGWEVDTGDPQIYIKDMDENVLRLYPIPATSGTVNLTVSRLPLVDMDDGDNSPEIRTAYHLALVHWMVYRAYSKQDTQTYNPKAAGEAMAMFEAEFGKRSSAQNEAWIRQQHGFTPDEGTY